MVFMKKVLPNED
ncbi:Protein of unknown function [Bacillus wiedmannii]|nr:Protein of unknown function [Bacillus wiedmannii]